jgi:hypothetical protein
MDLLDDGGARAILPSGERLSLGKSIMRGYTPVTPKPGNAAEVEAIATQIEATGNVTSQNAKAIFAARLASTDAAVQRPGAALRVADAYFGAWDLPRATQFLAGLPVEYGEESRIVVNTSDLLTMRVEKRIRELSTVQDYQQQEVGRTLAYCLELSKRHNGMSLRTALTSFRIDSDKV